VNCLFIHVTLFPYIKSSANTNQSHPHRPRNCIQGYLPDIIIARPTKRTKTPSSKRSRFSAMWSRTRHRELRCPSFMRRPLCWRETACEYRCRKLSIACAKAICRNGPRCWKGSGKRPTGHHHPGGKIRKLHDAIFPSRNRFTTRVKKPVRKSNRMGGLRAHHRKTAARFCRNCDGIIVPGGFGDRGIEA
jgi:CTP synthase